MKKILPFFVLIILLSCQPAELKVDQAAEISLIETTLDRYVLANEKEDISLARSVWADYDDITLFGTDFDEKLVGWETISQTIQNQYSLIENTLISVSDQNIKLDTDGKFAWFSERLDYNFVYKDSAQKYDGLRFTGVLEKIDGQWKILQAHLSLPAGTKIIR